MGLRSRDFPPQGGGELPEHNALADALWNLCVRIHLLALLDKPDSELPPEWLAAKIFLNHTPR